MLKDGASSVYGTDAVGGVINFILRNNFKGLDRLRPVSPTSRSKAAATSTASSLVGGLGATWTATSYNILATLSA